MGHKFPIFVFCLMLIMVCGVGGTLAYLKTSTESVINTFTGAKVDNEIVEDFKDNVKSSIRVQNTGETSVYIRIKLVSYRVDEEGVRIGGSAPIDSFELSEAWIECNGCYYYKTPLPVGTLTDNMIISSEVDKGITLREYSDADGGKQVIEVMSEAIQAEPEDAVEEAWTTSEVVVEVNDDGSLNVSNKLVISTE